jgi:hypothetical protein
VHAEPDPRLRHPYPSPAGDLSAGPAGDRAGNDFDYFAVSQPCPAPSPAPSSSWLDREESSTAAILALTASEAPTLGRLREMAAVAHHAIRAIDIALRRAS